MKAVASNLLHLWVALALGVVLILNALELRRLKTMSAELDRLTNEVSETAGVVDSAIALINGLAQQIRDLSSDPAALNALADSLDAKTNELAAAVTDNQPPSTGPAQPDEG